MTKTDNGMEVKTINLPNGQILQGDCRETLKELPAGSVHCSVSSPPYWSLRDYGCDGQIGLEDSMEAFISELVGVYREVWRVLRDDGVVWLNLGDSYSGSGRGGKPPESPHQKQATNRGCLIGQSARDNAVTNGAGDTRIVSGLKPKDLCGIPWRVALALQADGWYLRQDIVWAKPNPMPESCRDRCTKAHEYLFLLTKKPRYWYDAEGIREEPVSDYPTAESMRGVGFHDHNSDASLGQRKPTNRKAIPEMGRNKRSVWTIRDDEALLRWLCENHPEVADEFAAFKPDVWTIPTYSYKGAHFATFPPKLVEPCILAGCPEVCCSECGAGHVRILEKVRRPTRPGEKTKIKMPDGWDTGEGGHGSFHRNGREKGGYRETAEVGNRDPERHVTETITTGWQPSCECNAGTAPGVVLDPFGGSGTTGEVAKDLGRWFILCELNPKYVKLMKKRLEQGALC